MVHRGKRARRFKKRPVQVISYQVIKLTIYGQPQQRFEYHKRTRRTAMASFSIALTGLQANSVALNTIGNNLANLNTTAFKKQSTTFEDLFYQQIGTSGSNNPLQVGVGTRVSGTSTNFLQGTLVPTGHSTDM